ncbi:MAG: cell division protein ZapE, partial [Burkholderiales bacterium]|nr:cell division protein ZapE [Burkholderiales bacterium]
MATGSAARSAGIVTAGTIGDLLAAFEARAAAQGFSLDPAQRDTITHFARLEADLHRAAKKRSGWFAFLSGPDHVRGLYLWGGVGRGKSFLMDGFFEASGEPHKRRVHFHRFMQEIHGRLKTLQGESDPLRRIAAIVAAETRLLCLDEFQVVDIGDAMLLGNLLQALVGEGVAVVTTSNTPPSKLYEHGLQRDNFMPAIRLIE